MKRHFNLALLATSMFISITGTAQVTGRNVTFVGFNNGSFAQNTDGTWNQKIHSDLFNLKETKRDESSVYLFDASRNTSIQLDIAKKEVYVSADKPQKEKLADVTEVLDGPVGYTKCTFQDGTFLSNDIIDVAYGANGKFTYKTHVSGTIRFDSKTFGDPTPGVEKAGYYKVAIRMTKPTNDY